LLTNQKLENYFVEPLKFPIILYTPIYYQITKPSTQTWKCDGKTFKYSKKRSKFKFSAPPPSKQLCIATVYVDPKPCKAWKGTEFFPASFMDPIFHYKIEKGLQSKNT